MNSQDLFPDRPMPSFFMDPILRVVVRASGYVSGQSTSLESIYDETLIESGICPIDPPWPVHGREPLGLYAIIKQALAAAAEEGLLVLERDSCSLTVEGVIQAKLTEDRISGECYDESLPETPVFRQPENNDDIRDSQTWVALQLSKTGEKKIEDGTLRKSLAKNLGVSANYPIFIPSVRYVKGLRNFTVHLMEGYVFVQSGLDEVRYFALERRIEVKKIMSTSSKSGMRVLSVISDAQINHLRSQLRIEVSLDINVGDSVNIIRGLYSKLYGVVTLDIGDRASVFVQLRSTSFTVDLPKVFLEIQSIK